MLLKLCELETFEEKKLTSLKYSWQKREEMHVKVLDYQSDASRGGGEILIFC